MRNEFVLGNGIATPKNCFGKSLRVICVPKIMVENNILHSNDGMENRMIAKDMLYKFDEWLIRNKNRSIRHIILNPGENENHNNLGAPVLIPHIRTWFKEFIAQLDCHRVE